MAHEVYARNKKRPMYMAKEAYAHCKRSRQTWQKRPMYISNETCAHSEGNTRIYHTHNFFFVGGLAKQTASSLPPLAQEAPLESHT